MTIEMEKLCAELEQVKAERDEARGELETLRALVEGEPRAGAVVLRERDQARAELAAARRRGCTRESCCGTCEPESFQS